MPNLQKSTSPSGLLVAVTPADGSDLTNGICRGIYVGASGNLSIVDASGNTVALSGIAGGVVHPIQAIRIRSTGTTATGIVACY